MTVARAVCPGCGAGLKSPAGFVIGQAVNCPRCKQAFTVEEPAAEIPPPPPKAGTGPKKPMRVAAVVGDDEDDRPRKKRPREDEDDDRPRKKKRKKGGYSTSPVRFVVIGVLLVVLGVMSYLLYEKRKRDAAAEASNNARATSPDDDLATPVRPGPGKTGGENPTPRKDTTPITRVAAGPRTAMKMEDLRRVGLAMHNHADANGGRLPAAAVCDPSGKPLLSWRVAILPFLELDALHKQFKLNEPWDSEHNKKLLDKMPRTYLTPGAPDGYTALKVFAGNGAAFDLKQGRRMFDFPDGTSNTLLAAAAGEAVPWTKPEDFAFDPAGPVPDLTAWEGGSTTAVVLADGSTLRANMKALPPATVKALITAAGGEVVDNWR